MKRGMDKRESCSVINHKEKKANYYYSKYFVDKITSKHTGKTKGFFID